MAKALLIAEKPSLMREIYSVYNKITMSDTIDFMAFAGHTMTLCEPGDYKKEWGEKKWTWDMVPIIPTTFKCKVAKGKDKIFNEIKNKINTGSYDYLINACDPDREGETIFQYVVDFLGCKLPVKRFWSNDLTEGPIKNALINLRDSKEPFLKNLSEESKLRGQFDWLIGMNLTVASSLQMHGTAKVGRVKSPTLKIVVDRELEIRNFVSATSYELEGVFEDYSGVYFDKEGIVRFKDKKDADRVIKDLKEDSIVESIEKKTETTNAPQLFNLNTLQKEAGRLYGFKADDVLALAQSLYEKKYTTYPRSDNQFVSTEIADTFPKRLETISYWTDISLIAKKALADTASHIKVAKNKSYVDNKKMAESGHFAIIPTTEKADIAKLSNNEKTLYDLICRRFLAIFLPPMKVHKTVIITNSNDYLFRTTGKKMLDKGYTILYKIATADVELPPLKKGDRVKLTDTKINEKVSTAPKRYTSSTLIDVLSNPVRFLIDNELKDVIKENKGIGTTATRSGIINELIANEYIEEKKSGKQTYLYATDKGINIIDNLKDKDIVSVDMTGIWEEKLSDVGSGKMSPSDFKKQMIDYVLKSIDDIKKSTMKNIQYSSSSSEVLGKCPKCGKNVMEGKDYYKCEEYKKTCDFILSKTHVGAKISKTDVKKILNGEQTREISFSKKNEDGTTKKWKTKLEYNKAEKRISFVNNQTASNGSTSSLKCPKCGKPLKITDKWVLCSEYKSPCEFILNREFFKAKITDKDIEKLLKGDTIEKTFVWKSGKSGKAKLKLESNKYKLIF